MSCKHYYDLINVIEDDEKKQWYLFYCKHCLEMQFFTPQFTKENKS